MQCSRGLALLVGMGVVALGGRPLAGQAVAEVQVSPPTVSLAAGQTQGIFATAYDRSGNVVPTAQFTWASDNPAVARVDPDPSAPGVALVVAVGPGQATITARSGNQRGTAIVQVVGGDGEAPVIGTGPAAIIRINPQNILLLPSEERQLVPVFLREDGEPASPQQVAWESLNPTVATVSSTGAVTAVSEGQAVIRVTSRTGLSASAPLEVSRAPFAFSRSIVSLSPGGETQIEVIVPSQDNRILPGTALSWSSSDGNVATVTQLGLVRAVGPGSTRIVASGFLTNQTVEVRVHRPVTTMELLPGPSRPAVVPFNGAIQFEAEALAADGTPVPEAPMLWRVEDTTIARFDSETNQLHGLQLGTTVLHLRGPGPDVLEASWNVEVVAGGLAITPARRGLGVRDTVNLSASFTDSTGMPISAASGHTWSTSDENVAQVTGSGLVTAIGRGHAAIVASTSWGAADTAHVYVQGELLFAATRGGSVNIWAVDRNALGNATQVTADPGTEVAPAYSPDGSRIAFVSTRDGNPEIYVANADGSDPVRLTETVSGREDAPVWSRDGSRLFFAASEPGGRAQIFVMNADGSGRRTLTPDASSTSFQPAVSPDGSTIAFTTTRDGNYELYLMNADGSNLRNVTNTPGKESAPRWFPNGELAYLSETRTGTALQSVVMRRNLETSQEAPLTPADLMVTNFAVSPDGLWLALQVEQFGQDGGISRRIHLLELGNVPRALPAEAGEQQLSPNWR